MKNKNHKTEKAIRQYLRSVKREVNCSPARKAKVLEQLETDILLYAEEHELSDISEIVRRFGSPEEIAKSFMEELDMKEATHSLKSNRKIIAIILTIVFVTAVTVIVLTVYNFWRNERFRGGYYVETYTKKSPLHSPEDASSGVLYID